MRATRDKVKWSVYARKQFNPALRLLAQVASDHYRAFNFSAEPDPEPVCRNWNHWYYLLRLEFGI
jgi:hypothetical protein